MKALEFLLYTIIFFIPTYLVRFHVFGIPMNVLEALVGIAFVGWLIRNFQFSIFNFQSIFNSKFPKYDDRLLIVTGIFLLFVGLAFGVIVSPDTTTSLGALKSWFLVPVAFFVVARSVLDTEAKKENALWSLAFSGVAVSLIGFFYWTQGNLTFDGRLRAFYESPNMLAMYLAPALLIVTQALVQSSKFKVQNFLLFSFALVIFILLFTRSAGAFIGLGGALAFYFSTILWGKWRENLGKIVIISIILIGIGLPFTSLFLNPWDMGRTSLASRLMIWQASARMLNDHWLLGVGPGVFQDTYLAYQNQFPPFLEWAVPHPHNIFLATWLYGGAFGIAGLMLLLTWFFKNSLQPISINFNQFLLISLVIYVLLHGTFDNTLWRNDTSFIFLLILAII